MEQIIGGKILEKQDANQEKEGITQGEEVLVKAMIGIKGIREKEVILLKRITIK